MDRRQWLRRAGGGAAGLMIGAGSLASQAATAAPQISPNDSSFHPRRVQGRVPPEEDLVLLDSNENPHGPSPAARTVVVDAFEESFRYPGEVYGTLLEQIAEREQVSTDHVVLGTGSTEVLCMAGAAYGLGGGEIVTGTPSYQGVTEYARTMGGYVNEVPLTDELRLDLAAMDKRTTASTSLVFVCNPNNPTGTVVNPKALGRFCEEVSRRAVVFIDEAYIDFVEDDKRPDAVELVRQGENVIVSRTFSKLFGMAGLRIGYGIARPDIVERLDAYSMGMPNVIGLHAASESLKDTEFQATSQTKIVEARDYTASVLDDLELEYATSQASFVFFRTGRDVTTIQKEMREQGVEVGRPFPPYTDWCRVSMGTMEDMNDFETALRRVMT